MGSSALEKMLDLETTDERVQQLRMMTDEGRRVLFEEWSQDDRLMASDVVALPMAFQVPLVNFICGHPQRGLVGSGKTFYVKPNADWNPPEKLGLEKEVIESMRRTVLLENGSRNNGRQYVPIRKATVVPSDKGIQAMLQFGPSATSDLGRNRLIELTAAEYATESAGAEQKQAIEKATQRADTVLEENERLKRELEKLKKRRK